MARKKLLSRVKRKLQPGDKWSGPSRQQRLLFQGCTDGRHLPFLRMAPPTRSLTRCACSIAFMKRCGQYLGDPHGLGARGLASTSTRPAGNYKRSGEFTPCARSMHHSSWRTDRYRRASLAWRGMLLLGRRPKNVRTACRRMLPRPRFSMGAKEADVTMTV